MKTPVAMMLSGRGSNFLALQDAIDRGEIPARTVLVLSNVREAPGLEAARSRGLPTACLPHRDEPSRAAHEEKILAALRDAGAEWICLAGYMRVLSPRFVEAFPGRILNVHPSLLPSFPGLDAQKQAFEHGVKVAGCTVHLVDVGVDTGPIVVQRSVDVSHAETAEELSRLVLREEHQAYAEALRRLLTEPWEVEGRRLRFLAAPAESPR